MSAPTFAQEEYASSLTKRMRDDNLLGAESYAKKVMRCQDRQGMSQLIAAMKRELEQADSFVGDRL